KYVVGESPDSEVSVIRLDAIGKKDEVDLRSLGQVGDSRLIHPRTLDRQVDDPAIVVKAGKLRRRLDVPGGRKLGARQRRTAGCQSSQDSRQVILKKAGPLHQRIERPCA